MMVKTKRDIGQEILEGLRQLRRGEYGRVISGGLRRELAPPEGLDARDHDSPGDRAA
jgi:hypothetical protein